MLRMCQYTVIFTGLSERCCICVIASTAVLISTVIQPFVWCSNELTELADDANCLLYLVELAWCSVACGSPQAQMRHDSRHVMASQSNVSFVRTPTAL